MATLRALPHLNRFRERQIAVARGGTDPEHAAAWVADNTLLAGLRVGLRETYLYLLSRQPSLEDFEAWLIEKNGGSIEPERIERLQAALSEAGVTGQPADPQAEPALSEADLEFWDEHGYVTLRDAVPPENCRAAVQAICEFLGVALDRPETWYGAKQGHTIWTPLLHHPAIWANRNSPRIHRAFAQLWNREDIWINVDQAGFNPPERPDWPFPGPHLHWDVSLALPFASDAPRHHAIPFGVQGILYLVDVAADQGAFTCVPGFHKKIEAWLESLPPAADPRAQAMSELTTVPIAGRAGDLIIWHQALPHASSPNRSCVPRIVQYMTGRPSHWDYNPNWR